MDLAAIAVELYSLVPSEFTAARTARAKEVKSRGEAELAKQIAKLPKPSTSAWAVNVLVRQGAEEFASVLELGASLANAQEEHDAEALRTLGQQRQPVLAAAVEEASSVALGLGVKVSASAALEIEATLRAAMTDPDAAKALRTGLLVRSLSTNGLEPVDLSDAVAVEGAVPVALASPGTGPSRADLKAVPDEGGRKGGRQGARAARKGEPERDNVEREQAEPKRDDSRRQREKAQGAVDEAERNAAAAESELADAERAKAAAARRRDELVVEVKAAKEKLAALQQELATAEWQITLAERDRRQAERAASRERRAAETARNRLKQIK